MPYVKLTKLHQNLELYYEVHGTGEIKILFIMGILSGGIFWTLQTEFFRQQSEYQCVSYDNRGCGRSSSPFTLNYTTVQMAKDAIALIDHLKWSKCHVVGYSMGGMIAVEFALLAPERVLSLTLLCTHAGGVPSCPPFVGIYQILPCLRLRGKGLPTQIIITMLFGAKTLANAEKREFFRQYCKKTLLKYTLPSLIGAIGHLFAVTRHYVSYADLLKIRYSSFDCLIMIGTEDRFVREANSYIIRRALGCRLIKFDDAGHGLTAEYANEINNTLLDWYESIRLNGPAKTQSKISEKYKTEIKALEQCCQHRTHCFIYNIVGFIQGLFLGLTVYMLLTKVPIAGVYLSFGSIILFGCLNGLRRAIKCVYHGFRARHFVRKHRLLPNRTADRNGLGVALLEKPKNRIPHGCGFEFPIHSIIFIISTIGLLYLINT